MENKIERLPVTMICENLDKKIVFEFAQRYKISEEFLIRNYKKGEENFWAEVETAAGEFKTEKEALERFEKEFGTTRMRWKTGAFLSYIRKVTELSEQLLHGTTMILEEKDTVEYIG